jgi:uncharacterized protein YndB with AHSA1/START domain
MWTVEHSVETDTTPEEVWRAWADVERWPAWNGDIERISIDGPFTTGSTIAMTPKGQETVALRIAEAVENELFVDEADVDGTIVRTTHRIDRLGGDRVRIVYRLEVTGPAEGQIGPAVTADFDETLNSLVEYAGS